ncbi:SGNH/GDSL hydrolase family protein [uncultured Roseobacter sp.]|uniref:SGNH/GDSL hydrolase family protein n=1 Tax=uncultured Roseobacter sp. TaxID=114847 RepID=UPI0026221415|nr:SGNH/GDSL hydrolase family protein [uncultured Roseobacter sp.]
MKNQILSFGLAIGLATGAHSGTLDFTSYYAFGDSLSDDGKLVQLAPPSVGGRFSNGPVWTEIIADRFRAARKETQNYALGGATAGNTNTTDYSGGATVPPAQVAALTALSTFQNQAATFAATVGNAGSNPLVSVLFGANDFFQQLGTPEFNPVRTAGEVIDGIRAVAATGAHFDDFLVSNLPDISRTPAFNAELVVAQATLAALKLDPATDPADIAVAEATVAKLNGRAAAIQGASLLFNAELENGLQKLETDDGLTITRVDQFSYFNDLIDRADTLGIVDTIFPCTTSLRVLQVAGNCSFVGLDADGQPLFDPTRADQVLFADGVHPNRIAQSEFAKFALSRIESQIPAPVPLPAGLPLMLAGLGALGVIARRRRAA